MIAFLKRYRKVVGWCIFIFTISSIPSLPKVGFIWWDFVLKKSAHMLEYAVLFTLTLRAMAKRSPQTAFLFSLAFALSDEYHQSFIPGRTALFSDVLFDSFGMLVAYWRYRGSARNNLQSQEENIISNSIKQTNQIAANVAKRLKPGSVVAFTGELGAGKTTMIQAIARSLGIRGPIPSPTYILARSYRIPGGNVSVLSGKTLYHIDLYRLESAADLRAIDLAEIMENHDNITLIEWAQKAKDVLPSNRIDINMVYMGEKKRQITIHTVHKPG